MDPASQTEELNGRGKPLKRQSACDLCRVARARCSRKNEGCQRCDELGQSCTFSPRKPPRKRRKAGRLAALAASTTNTKVVPTPTHHGSAWTDGPILNELGGEEELMPAFDLNFPTSPVYSPEQPESIAEAEKTGESNLTLRAAADNFEKEILRFMKEATFHPEEGAEYLRYFAEELLVQARELCRPEKVLGQEYPGMTLNPMLMNNPIMQRSTALQSCSLQCSLYS